MSRTITIRNMPPELEKRIEMVADEEGTSLAQTVIRLLLRATGLQRFDGREGQGAEAEGHHDLDELAGTWNAEQGEEFERALDEQRRIDHAIWD